MKPDPQPSTQTTDAYYTQHGKEWAKEHEDKHYWGNYFEKFYELSTGKDLIEIGFGGFRDGAELVENGYNYTGIDAVSTMVEFAQESGANGKFLQMRAQDLNFSEEFDCFWAAASLLHIPKAEIDLVMQNIFKALRANGVGLISLKKKVDDGPDERIETDHFGSRLFVYWTMEDFKEVLNRNGFEIIFSETEEKSSKTTWLKFIVRKINES